MSRYIISPETSQDLNAIADYFLNILNYDGYL
jgi:plasmid stabilization system protein ParE